MQLSVKGLAFSIGIIEGLVFFVLGLTAMGGYGEAFVNAVSTLAIGYDASVAGAVIGAIWGFVDGLIGGALIAVIYNHFA